jgi:hypothetical protein
MISHVELDAKLAAMWKGSNDAIELTDVVDGTRTDLFERFDLEVQALVSGVRGSARIPRLVLSPGSPEDDSGAGTGSGSGSGGSGSGVAVVLGLRGGVPFLNDVTASPAVPLDTWITLVASWDEGTGTLSVLDGGVVFLLGAKTGPGAGFTSHFSGRIERPALLSGAIGAREAAALVGAPGDPVPTTAVALWERSAAAGRRTGPPRASAAVDKASAAERQWATGQANAATELRSY